LSVLRSIESKLESLFEGVFGRAFRTHVQPVELARKLVKEMDDHRTVSVSRVYVPNEYSVYLSTNDREQFSTYEGALKTELQDYLAEHARREGYVLLSAPTVTMYTDEDLVVGEFGIATRMAQRTQRTRQSKAEHEAPASADDAPAAEQIEAGATMVYKPKAAGGPTEAVSAEELGVVRETVTLTVDGEPHELDKRRVVLGRSKECDIQLGDPNVSRRHAEVRQEGTAYWIVDLESTNGVEVNGERTPRAKLEHGDRIVLGSTELVFERMVEE
jgi:pSer/pThr/pTyr-binding forkhead associated (FHA) protein